MTSNHGLPLVAPQVVPVLEPGFRPAVLAVRAFDALARESGSPVAVRMALEQTDGSVFHFETRLLPPGHAHSAGNAVHLERFVKFILWSRGGWRLHIDAPADDVARLSGSLSRHACRTVRLEFRRRARFRSPAHHRPHAGPAAGTVGDQAARPSPERQPYRLRSRRQRPEGGRGRRGPCRLQRRDGLGPVPQAGSAVSLRRDHGLAAQGRGASPARRRHRRQRRRRLRQQPGPRWFAVSRRAHRISSMRTSGTCFSTCARPGTTCRSRS